MNSYSYTSFPLFYFSPFSLEIIMDSMVIKIFTVFISLQLLLVAAHRSERCPHCSHHQSDSQLHYPSVEQSETVHAPNFNGINTEPHQPTYSGRSGNNFEEPVQQPVFEPTSIHSRRPHYDFGLEESVLQQTFGPQPPIYSGPTNSDFDESLLRSPPSTTPSVSSRSTNPHMGPNEISASAESFSRKIFRVSCQNVIFVILTSSLTFCILFSSRLDIDCISTNFRKKFRHLTVFDMVADDFSGRRCIG